MPVRSVEAPVHVRFFGGIEVVIGQDALTIPHIELLAAVSSPWLVANFQQGGGGFTYGRTPVSKVRG